MNDDHGDPGLKSFEQANEPGRFRALFPIITRRVKVINHRQARIPNLGHPLLDLLYGLGILNSREATVSANRQNTDLLFDSYLQIAIKKIRTSNQGSHMRVDMGGMESHGLGLLDLRADL